MVVSALDAVAAADTRATAAPLIYPTTASRLVALLSRWQSAGKKKLENPLGWLVYWLATLVPTLKNQAQIELLEVTARLTQW
jgi:hypothetical protein